MSTVNSSGIVSNFRCYSFTYKKKEVYVLMTLQNAGSLGLSTAVLMSATDCTLGTHTRKYLAVILVSEKDVVCAN